MEYDPDKGQHFLIDEEVLGIEVKEANLVKKDRVIEIGAGKGILTQELADKAGEVLAFEIDGRFEEELREIKKVKFVMGNALSYDWRGYNKIVSNISYSLSEPVVMKAIWDGIDEMILIVGENFKELLFSKESKIGAVANLNYNIKPIVKVNKEAFEPAPRVDSWLVKFKAKKCTKIEEFLKRVIFRNGKIKNSLLYSFVEEGKTKKEAREIIAEMGIDEDVLEKPTAKITARFILKLEEELVKFL